MSDMTIVERAINALTGITTESQLKKLASEFTEITEINNETDYQLVKSSQLKLRDTRVAIEKAAKSARDDANAFSKAVIAEERRLVGIISPEEQRLKTLRQEVDDEKKRIEEEKAAKEKARIEEIYRLVAVIENMRPHPNANSAAIKECINWLNKEPIDDRYGEFKEDAENAIMDSLKVCNDALKAREEFEAEQARLEVARKEQEAEQARLDAERKKIEDERRKAELAHKNEQDKIDAERRKVEQEKLRIQLEKEARETAEREARERAERERRDAEARAKAEQEERERIERQKPDIEKLKDFANAIASIPTPDISDKECQKVAQNASGLLIKARENLYTFVDSVEPVI